MNNYNFDIHTKFCVQNYTTSPTPNIAPKGNYGTVNLSPVISMFDQLSKRITPVINDIPLCFEDMDINHGLVLYETTLPQAIDRLIELPLVIDVIHDRAIIFLNNVCTQIHNT